MDDCIKYDQDSVSISDLANLKEPVISENEKRRLKDLYDDPDDE